MSPQVEAALIAAGVGVLTVITTAFTQYLGRRATSKQLDRTLGEQRLRTLNERFATSARQLGDDKPAAVRLAGVYAMAGLAEDWEENRQTCVDVLCGYLRLPYDPDPGNDADPAERAAYLANREVRHTAIRVITAHLQAGAAESWQRWQGLNFDFTGVVFDGGDFTGAEFSGGQVRFDSAVFSGGQVHFGGAKFSGSTVLFDSAVFSGGTVRFGGAEFSGGTVSFHGAVFSGGEVDFDSAKFSGGTVRFDYAMFSGSTVRFGGAKFSRGTVLFDSAPFTDGTVLFDSAKFSGSTVRFDSAVFSGSTVRFDYTKFSGGTVRFDYTEFPGGEVRFDRAEFSGGEVDFTNSRDWSVPPAFPLIGVPPQGVTLPKKEDQIPGVGMPDPSDMRSPDLPHVSLHGMGARLQTMLRDGAGIGGDLARQGQCRLLNSHVKSGQDPVRTSGATLRSPRQRPRSSQPSAGQDTGLSFPGKGVGVQIYLSCRVSAFRPTCRVA